MIATGTSPFRVIIGPAMKSRGGLWCWCCDRVRANERFSGKGHARHLCRDCERLGAAELAFRQGQRAVDRLVSPFGTIPRRNREAFDRFLRHRNLRLRAYAHEVQARHEEEVARSRLADDQGLEAAPEGAASQEATGESDDIPF